MESQAPIYKNIVCLEIPSANGPKWWYQGASLAYSPIPVNAIKQIALGTLRKSNKKVFSTAIDVAGEPKIVAINMQRSDVWAMVKHKLIAPNTPLPRQNPNYSQKPEKI
jgi:hypothetical protein